MDPLLHKKLVTLWTSLKARCNTKTSTMYPHYGARGITICARWCEKGREGSGFSNFLDDMGPPPFERYRIMLLDGATEYSKDNCAWAPLRDRESSKLKYNILGEELSLAEIMDKYEVPKKLFLSRVANGWTHELAASEKRTRKEYERIWHRGKERLRAVAINTYVLKKRTGIKEGGLKRKKIIEQRRGYKSEQYYDVLYCSLLNYNILEYVDDRDGVGTFDLLLRIPHIDPAQSDQEALNAMQTALRMPQLQVKNTTVCAQRRANVIPVRDAPKDARKKASAE